VDVLQVYNGNRHDVYFTLKGILLLLALCWLLTEILQRLQGVVQIYAFPRFRSSIRDAVFKYVQSHSHEFFSSQFAGNIAKKFADLPTSCQIVIEIVCLQFVIAITGASVVIFMLCTTKPLFAVILIIWLAIHLGLTTIFLTRCNHMWVAHSSSLSVLSGKIVDVLTNMANVRLFSRASYESKYLKRFQNDEIAKAKQAMWMMEYVHIGLGLNGLFLVFGMVFTLLYGWTNNWVTLGDFTQIGMQTFWLLSWIWFISYQMTVFSRELGTISEALNLVRKGHGLSDTHDAYPIKIKQGEIRFEDMTFHYNKNRRVFKKLNLTIAGGQKIGLVGFSGSGKSTFVNLILRFYDVQSGKIFIDGHEIARVTQESLRSQISMIPQDPSLFNRTLMENIRYGRLDASDEEVIEASKLAHCHEFIEMMDEGYHSMVGERGIKLSGGQRQRIAIARAILKNAPILILDEATSSLDTATEKMIQQSLHQVMQNKTTIVVAHRLSTLSAMDRIIVFHKGKVIEEGSQQELLKAKGHFAMLWNMQTDGFLPDGK
jgi:ATP-binding cassette subfamily B protein